MVNHYLTNCDTVHICMTRPPWVNTLRPRLSRRPFADNIFKCIFLNENEWILPRISLKFVPKVWINNIPALVQIMAWRRPGDKPLSEPMMVCFLTHICVTRPQWVKKACHIAYIYHTSWLHATVISYELDFHLNPSYTFLESQLIL